MNRLPLHKLLEKEGIASVIFLILILFLAILASPEVGTSGQAPLVEYAAAPWVFGPVQVLLFYVSPWIAALLFPLLIVASLVFLPWISRYLGDNAGRAVFLVTSGIIVCLLLGFMLKERVM